MQEEISTFSLLHAKKRLNAIKSPTNAHQWFVYVGSETREELLEVLGDSINTIELLRKLDRPV